MIGEGHVSIRKTGGENEIDYRLGIFVVAVIAERTSTQNIASKQRHTYHIQERAIFAPVIYELVDRL